MLRFLRRVRALVWRTRLDRDLREELAQHVEWKAQSYIASGVCDAEAHRRAAVDVGNITRLREDARAMWGFPTADSLLQDLVYGARLLRRSRAFTVTSVLSLAIGIGATAAVFSLAEVVLVRELPVADPGSLFVVKWQSGAVFPFASLNGTAQENDSGLASTSFSYAAYDTFRADAANVVDVLGFADLYQINLAGDGHAEVATAHAVSGNYFDVLGLAPAAGRALSAFATAPRQQRSSAAVWPSAVSAAPRLLSEGALRSIQSPSPSSASCLPLSTEPARSGRIRTSTFRSR
jgi:macrolide transport system ATP-binding/permease protein